MQLMPGTARELGLNVPDCDWVNSPDACDKNSDERFNPEQNIMAGTHYLKIVQSRVNNNCNSNFAIDSQQVMAGYNWGSARSAICTGTTDNYPSETQTYISVVTGYEQTCQANNMITGGATSADSVGSADSGSSGSLGVSSSLGTYKFQPSFTVKVKKDLKDPLKPVTDWFKDTWSSCTDDPKTCINNKIKEFNSKNSKSTDYEISFADQCAGNYPFFYSMLESMEDCLSNGKFKCSCEFNLKDTAIYSANDLLIMFDTQENTATLQEKQADGTYKQIDSYSFAFGNIIMPAGSAFKYYLLRLAFNKDKSLKSASMIQVKPDLDILDTVTFNDYTTLKLVKPDKAGEGYFVNVANTDTVKCEYTKNKFSLCAKPRDETKTELQTISFSLTLKDKPPEPVKKGDVKIVETSISSDSEVNKILDAAGIVGAVYPPLGFMFSLGSILNSLPASKPMNLEVMVDVPKDKNGSLLDVAGYEVYCNDYLTSMLPTDVLNKYNPSNFVVMANNGMNNPVSQLDKYINTNTYSDFQELKNCKVSVSKASGETVLVPGINGMVQNGTMVFNLNKCGNFPMLSDKVLKKNYCVSLVPVDKNGNKMTDQAISNCAQTNSLLDIAIDQLIKRELGSFIPTGLIPKSLQSYIQLPDANQLADAAMGKKSLDMASIVNPDKLSSDVRNDLDSFVVNAINKDIVSNSFVSSTNDLKVWEKQTVLNSLSKQITNPDANTLFNSFVQGNGVGVTSSAQHMALSKGVDYMDQSKAPGILKQVANGGDPQSLAYNELIKSAESSLSSEQKKQDLMDLANNGTPSGNAVHDKLIQKAVDKGCYEHYGITVDQAVGCLRNDEINDVYHDIMTDYSTPDNAKKALLNKAVDKMGNNAPSALKNVAVQKDFQGAAADALEKELDKISSSDKRRFVSDVLEGRMPDSNTLQSEAVRMIPNINTNYVSTLLQNTNVNALIESSFKSYLQEQVNSFVSGGCQVKNLTIANI